MNPGQVIQSQWWREFKEKGMSMEKDNPHRVNVYVCDNEHQTVTFDQDTGVTPMFLPCFHEGCKLDARSSMYTIPHAEALYQDTFKTAKRWITLPLKQVPARDFEHVLKGGLLLAHADGSLVWPGPPRVGNGARTLIRRSKKGKGESFADKVRKGLAAKNRKGPK